MEEYQHNNPYAQPRQTAPNAVASLVLGIASIVVSGVGFTLVLGIIGLVLSNKGLNEYQAHPERYTGDGMLQAGKITSIVGIVLGALSLLVIIPLLLFAFGVFAVSLGNI
jgi:hypothetical protein